MGGGGAVQPSLLPKLQAQVYDIVPPDTAMADYAIGLQKLPANEDFRCCSNGSKSVTDKLSLYQTVSFITDHVAYASTNKTNIV